MEVKWQRDGKTGLGFSDTQGRIDAFLTELKRVARQYDGLQPSRDNATPLIGAPDYPDVSSICHKPPI
jgi:hypothetical protein